MADPARILYLHTTSEVGGSDVSLARLVERLDRQRFSPIVAVPSDGPLIPRLKAAGAAVVVMPALWKLTSRRGRWFLAGFALHYPLAVRSLVRLIRRERIDLVHTNTIHNLYGGAAAARAHVPHVWHIREIVWQSAALRRLELALVRRWATRIVTTSEAVAAMFGPPGKRPPQLVKIPNGVETTRYAPGSGTRIRAELGVTPDQTLVGTVCRLDNWKGVDVFLDAAAAIARDRPSARFAVVGGPVIGQEDYAAALKQRASALGLDEVVRFSDWRFLPDEMPDVHRALDLLVLASTEPEPFGLVLLEAMATGKPVIATARGGPTEIVQDGVTGLLIPPRDAAALAAAIRTLLDDPATARAMGEAGRRRVVEHYGADRYAQRIQAMYGEILTIQNARCKMQN